MIETIAGMQVVTSKFMVRSEVVPRSWRERIFSLPWRPLRRWKSRQVPDERVIRHGNTLVMHPEIFARLRGRPLIG